MVAKIDSYPRPFSSLNIVISKICPTFPHCRIITQIYTRKKSLTKKWIKIIKFIEKKDCS
jgi:hypothetical protein